ncbi:MAG: hypothetical protein EAZ08_08535 [Cytophagales bacterium]|nr:MAG: hypothetical protein EAZ08_08535 [Cytophagales bacterium]
MKNRIRIYLGIITMIFFISCSLSKPQKQQLEDISGQWEETWGAGEPTNVDYADVYIITTNTQNKPTITCPKRKNYVFEQITFDGKKIITHLVIKDLKYGAGDAWVDYTLEMQEDKNSFKGTALTKAGKKATIIWKKIANL